MASSSQGTLAPSISTVLNDSQALGTDWITTYNLESCAKRFCLWKQHENLWVSMEFPEFSLSLAVPPECIQTCLFTLLKKYLAPHLGLLIGMWAWLQRCNPMASETHEWVAMNDVRPKVKLDLKSSLTWDTTTKFLLDSFWIQKSQFSIMQPRFFLKHGFILLK